MAKNGQAKVLSNEELGAVLDEIENHRYPAKNALIIQISFKLGLRAQEMALLRIREIAALSDEFACGYKIKDVLVLPKSFTKGARAMAAIGNKTNERTSVRFTVAEFDRLVKQIAKDARRKKKLERDRLLPGNQEIRWTDTRAATGGFCPVGGDFTVSGRAYGAQEAPETQCPAAYCPRKADSTARIHCRIIWRQCYVNGPASIAPAVTPGVAHWQRTYFMIKESI